MNGQTVNQVKALTDFYFQTIGANPDILEYQKKQNQIDILIKDNINTETIKEAILQSPYDMRTYIKSQPVNIMKKGVFYYHPALQIAPLAPIVQLNADGTFTDIVEDFYLKMKPRYSMEDILEYFYSRFPTVNKVYKRDLGSIQYLYKSAMDWVVNDEGLNPLDLLLFTIDTACVLIYDEDTELASAINLSEYLRDGLNIYRDKKTSYIYSAGEYKHD